VVVAAGPCTPGQQASPCPGVGARVVPANPRSLAGVFTLEWHPGPGPWSRNVRRERLWLWPTSSQDSTPVRGGTRATAGDTTDYPLFGTVTPETVPFAKADSLRADTDPIYPTVLMLARRGGVATPDSTTFILLVRTVSNRDRRLIINDGGGDAVDLDRVGRSGFAGPYGPWGIAMLDTGTACAIRLR